MRIENESTRVGASVGTGIAGVLFTEMLRAGGSYEDNSLMQMYEQNGELSRMMVAAVVALVAYCLLELKYIEQKEE